MAPVWRSKPTAMKTLPSSSLLNPVLAEGDFARRALERHARRAALREVRIGSWERHVFITDVRASSDRTLREAPGVLPIVVVVPQRLHKVALLHELAMINTTFRAELLELLDAMTLEVLAFY